jgi:hypothetical protein
MDGCVVSSVVVRGNLVGYAVQYIYIDIESFEMIVGLFTTCYIRVQYT